jgi:hypothetical protein
MNIFNYFRKHGIDTVDASFYRKIDEWISWYNSNVRQFSTYKVYSGRGTMPEKKYGNGKEAFRGYCRFVA